MHTSIDKPLFTLNGNVLTSGGAGNLAKGQLAIVTNKSVTGGAKVVSDFAGLPKNTPLKIRVGRNKLPQGLRSNYAPYYETSWFTPESIVSITANFPKHQKQKFDELIVGYDGINENTAFNIPLDKNSIFDLTIDGKAIEVFAGEKEHTIKLNFGRKTGETNQQVIRELVKRIQDYKLPRSQKPVSDFLEVSVIDSSNLALSGVSHTFSTINVVDNGDSNDLADIQAQYPTYIVVRTAREGLTSEYTILHPTASALADYTKTVVDVYTKDCANCLAGYSAIPGGVVYHVNIQDGGADLSTTVDDLPGTVSGTVVKVGQNAGVGIYSLVTDNAVTDAEFATFLGASSTKSTATFKVIGTTDSVCEDSNSTTYTWTAGTTCVKTTEQYFIQLKDTDCDASRLAELQLAYPGLVIEEGAPTGMSTQSITLTGSSGNAVININGVAYTTVYDTDLTTTATAFVTAHAPAILEAIGAVVTSSGAVITVTDKTVGFPTITATAGGLVETVGTRDYVTTATAGGCQRVYSTYVTTNLVCDECSDIYLQPFYSEAPQPFEQVAWKKVEPVFDEDALMGIRLKGKPFNLTPVELTRDEIPFYETSTGIKSVSGGYRDFDYLNITPAYNFEELFKVTRLSRKVDRDMLGNKFFALEDVSRAHYLGEVREKSNNFAKANAGEESLVKFNKQYITYHITHQDTSLSQGVGGRSNITHEEKIVVEFGYHDAIETLINKLASKAGVEVVNPTAN